MLPILNVIKLFILWIVFILIIDLSSSVAPKASNAVIENIADIKEFKKLLRTKNNVLVCFVSSLKKCSNTVKVFREAANSVKGYGTMVLIDCAGEAKKLCRKLKVTPEPCALKHYKYGEFHKDYDRKEVVSSMLNFMRDPAGDLPWDEDDSTASIVHLPEVNALQKLISKQELPVMVMFYAPWCGFCKQLKPEYVAAATELSGQAIMAAIDVNRPENAVVRSLFNITAFPTLMYFGNGKQILYEGDNKKQALVDFLKDPEVPQTKPKEKEWSDEDNDVSHLTDANFDAVLANVENALVLFYAPWCGHCKKMKPDYEKAAVKLKENGTPGMLAALNADKEHSTSKRFAVKGYPTLKYFKFGEFQYDVQLREEAKILEFIKDPKPPPPPPPPEVPWSELPSEVLHLNEDNFKSTLKKKKHTLVMFYAPWCGHCKKAKPEFTAAAERLKDDPRIALAAVDCTESAALCSSNDVSGYPTLKLFNYYNKQSPLEYDGGRLAQDFLNYMAPYSSLNLSDVKASSNTPSDDWRPEFVTVLDSQTFDQVLKAEPSLLVLFYAPWCGHCQKLKEPYAEAAKALAKSNVSGKMAAIDVAKHSSIGNRFSITGFPTMKYFRLGQLIAAYDGARTTDALISYMKNPPTVPNTEKAKDEL